MLKLFYLLIILRLGELRRRSLACCESHGWTCQNDDGTRSSRKMSPCSRNHSRKTKKMGKKSSKRKTPHIRILGAWSGDSLQCESPMSWKIQIDQTTSDPTKNENRDDLGHRKHEPTTR